MKSRTVIGLTGGIASGKSTVSDRLKELGCQIADADAVSRTLLEPGGEAYREVKAVFPDFFDNKGILDRRALGMHVFSDGSALKKLNAITHPAIYRLIESFISDKTGIVIIDAPLLIEVGLNRLCDRVWVVTADRNTRIERAALRNGMTKKEAEERMANQLSDDEKLKYADVVIENSGTMTELIEKVDSLYYGVKNESQKL